MWPSRKQTRDAENVTRHGVLTAALEKESAARGAGPSFVRLGKEVATGSVVNATRQIGVETQNGTGIGGHGAQTWSIYSRRRWALVSSCDMSVRKSIYRSRRE